MCRVASRAIPRKVVATTMIETHVLNRGYGAVCSPLDRMGLGGWVTAQGEGPEAVRLPELRFRARPRRLTFRERGTLGGSAYRASAPRCQERGMGVACGGLRGCAGDDRGTDAGKDAAERGGSGRVSGRIPGRPSSGQLLLGRCPGGSVPDSALIQAAKEGDAKRVNSLVTGFANANERDELGRPAIGWAVAGGSVGVVESLLLAGADPNAAAPDGTTALEIACKKGDAEIARVLLEAGADPCVQSNSGTTPITDAASSGSAEIVEMLLAAGVPIDTPGLDGATALFYAAQCDKPAVVELLLERGAAHIAHAPTGLTPLMQAARAGAVRVVELLLKFGADATLEDRFGHTASLMVAGGIIRSPARKQEYEEVQRLLAPFEPENKPTKRWWKLW